MPKKNKSYSGSNIKHNKRKRSFYGFGIALIAFFLIIPVLFIVIYFLSLPPQDAEAYHNDNERTGTDNHLPGHSISECTVEEEESVTGLLSNQYQDEETDTISNNNEDSKPEAEVTGVVYLTFDDGPMRSITPVILDILENEGAPATFFVLPHNDVDDLYRRIIDEGHEIGNHTSSHRYDRLYEGNASAFKEDVLNARRFIYDNFEYSTTSFRFPGGSTGTEAILKSGVRQARINVLNELGYTYYDWNIDTDDWRRDSTAESIVKHVLDSTNGREQIIILMHDNYQVTVDALPMLIEGLREQGYIFDILRNHN